MKCSEIFSALESEMPLSLAMEWDNPGLLLGNPEKKISKVLVALDATDDVIDYAAESGIDLLVTHHPLIFSPVKKITSDDPVGKRILRMAENGMAYIAMHTNYDVAPGCMADLAAARMGITGIPLEKTALVGNRMLGIGKTGNLKRAMTLTALSELVKQKFDLPFVTAFGREVCGDKVKRISICPGSGKGMYRFAKEENSEVLITGDVSHHDGLDAAEAGIAVINAGHYGLEHIFIDDMAGRIEKITGKGIRVSRYPLKFPEEVM